MAQREGSVYLYLFIGTFVLFVAMVVVFFVQDAKKSELEATIKNANADVARIKALSDKYNAELDAARKLINGTGTSNWPGDETFQKEVKDHGDFLNTAYSRLGETKPARVMNFLVEPLADYHDVIAKLLDSLKLAKEQQKRADEEKIQALEKAKTEAKKSDDLIAGLRAQLTETESKYVKEVSDVKKDNDRLQKEGQASKEQIASAEIETKRSMARVNNEILSLRQRLEKLMEETRKVKTIDDVEPDGQILDVASSSQIGWINIGRKQHLRPGLDFQVFQNVKGGKRKYKGRIEVQQVDEDISRFRILDTRDELNPLAKGDYITSPFYDPKSVPTFVFAGEGLDSKSVTQEGLRAKLLSYGAVIKDKVDLQTSFIIALKDYEKTDHYKEALNQGVAIIREREILEYMGL